PWSLAFPSPPLFRSLARRGVGVRVVALGPPARKLPRHPLLDAVGFVDKQRDARRFVQLVRSFHFGCLFSSAEAYGIGNLECQRLDRKSTRLNSSHVK